MLAIDVDIDPTLAPSVVNLVVLAAASAFASKDETQYYLNGVRVEFDETGATYVATDGHRMICFRDDLMQGKNLLVGSFIIPTAHCKHFKIGKEDDGLRQDVPGARTVDDRIWFRGRAFRADRRPIPELAPDNSAFRRKRRPCAIQPSPPR